MIRPAVIMSTIGATGTGRGHELLEVEEVFRPNDASDDCRDIAVFVVKGHQVDGVMEQVSAEKNETFMFLAVEEFFQVLGCYRCGYSVAPLVAEHRQGCPPGAGVA